MPETLQIASDYTPLPQQARFHASDAERLLFLGGVGSGKTLAGVHNAIYLLQDNTESDGCICSPTYPMLRDVVIPLWRTWVPHQLYTYKKADNVLVWHPTGRQIFLRSADRAERLQGLNLAWAWADEASQLRTARVWRTLSERLRCPKARRKCLYATTTPDGLNWLIREFRNPEQRGFVVRASTESNTHLDPDFARRLRSVYGEEYSAQYLDARVIEVKGNVWPYVPAIHNMPREEMTRRCVRYFGGVDWGYTNPSALIIGGIDGDGRWYLVDMWYKRQCDRSEVARVAKKMQKVWGVERWFSDHDPEGISQMQRVVDAKMEAACRVERAAKSVLDGVHYVRSLFAVRGDGKPRIYVEPTLRDWIREVEGYSFPDDGEVPVGAEGDHSLDACRYLMYTHSLRNVGGSNFRLPDMSQANAWGE
jgi:phage terminase large subunit-like protein